VKAALRIVAIAGTVLSLLAIGGGILISTSVHPSTPKILRVISVSQAQQKTPLTPVGLPAVTVSAGAAAAAVASGGPAFSTTDVTTYVTQHPMWRSTSPQVPVTVLQVVLASSKDVSALLGGMPTDQPSSALLYYVKVGGTFTFAGANGQIIGGQAAHLGYEVFDAHTGNLLMAGGLPGTVQDSFNVSPGTTSTVALAAMLPLTQRCPNGSHCYGTQDWPGGPIEGAQTSISVVNMYCGGTACGSAVGSGFIDNEEWVQDCSPDNCTGTGYGWVEAGYTTSGEGNNENEIYFYADDTNGLPSGYHEYPLGGVPGGDYGNSVTVLIERYSSDQFDVYIVSPNAYYFELSDIVTWTANNITIGQEAALVNTGTFANKAYYTNNYWISSNYNFNYQTNKGYGSYPTPGNPPYVGWVTAPARGGTGGKLDTYYPTQS
jgi:hypothetical protein